MATGGKLHWIVTPMLLVSVVSFCRASDGDRHPHYRSCVESCEKTGYVNKIQVPACSAVSEGLNLNFENPETFGLLQIFTDWDCKSECGYQCMRDTEVKRQALSEAPMKYHGKWPFIRVLNLQEPASVLFSICNLVTHLRGLLFYYRLLHRKLPKRTPSVGGKIPYYEFTALWMIYGAFSINSWFWSAVFHARDVRITEQLDYSSAVALLGYTLILTIIRTGSLRVEAAQVMVSAPIAAFVSTHILYLNLYDFDYGLNMKVCITMGIAQLLLWTGWAAVTHHPARFKLWFVVLGTILAMLLEVFDFPPLFGVLDAHALWHACTIPVTVFWWSFIRDDVRLRMTSLINRGVEARKVQ